MAVLLRHRQDPLMTFTVWQQGWVIPHLVCVCAALPIRNKPVTNAGLGCVLPGISADEKVLIASRCQAACERD